MKIAIWKTGHIIADTVADALVQGVINSEGMECYNNLAAMGDYNWPDAYIGYGILRHNCIEIANQHNKPYFELDRGYWGANHFDGTYRISYKGTQAKWHDDIPQQDIDFKLEDWKDNKGYVLVAPPTQAVRDFFGVSDLKWLDFLYSALAGNAAIIRVKGETHEIPWRHIKGVITFNSSIGWQALHRGIPVYSDPDHSIIGSYYKAKLKNPIDFLSDEYKQVDREPLFRAMAAHQFTLKQISEGKAWPILAHYLSTSGSTQENLPPAKSPPTP